MNFDAVNLIKCHSNNLSSIFECRFVVCNRLDELILSLNKAQSDLHLDKVFVCKCSSDSCRKIWEIGCKVMNFRWAKFRYKWNLNFRIFVFDVLSFKFSFFYNWEIFEVLDFSINHRIFKNPEVVKLVDNSQFSSLKNDGIVIN
jgi:hypothetical protein